MIKDKKRFVRIHVNVVNVENTADVLPTIPDFWGAEELTTGKLTPFRFFRYQSKGRKYYPGALTGQGWRRSGFDAWQLCMAGGGAGYIGEALLDSYLQSQADAIHAVLKALEDKRNVVILPGWTENSGTKP